MKTVIWIISASKWLPGKNLFVSAVSNWNSYTFLNSYVFSAPETMLDNVPGTLMLTDCLELCSSNDSCSSVNYETGLCVLFSSNADKLPGKQQRYFKYFEMRRKVKLLRNFHAGKPFRCSRCWNTTAEQKKPQVDRFLRKSNYQHEALTCGQITSSLQRCQWLYTQLFNLFSTNFLWGSLRCRKIINFELISH